MAIAQSSEAQAQIGLAFSDWGQTAPTATGLSQAETVLYEIYVAYGATLGMSQTQLNSLAVGYAASGTALTLANIVSTIASSQSQATDLVASALSNSYNDVAPDQATVLAALALGGESLLDATFNQANGLNMVPLQAILGNTNCSDPAAFIQQYVVKIQNSTQIVPANVALKTGYNQGVVWGGVNGDYRPQGVPFEAYVQQELSAQDSNYLWLQSVNPNYPMFDHWNPPIGGKGGDAVSDKTINTVTIPYTASRIRTTIDGYVNKMFDFNKSNKGGVLININTINKFTFELALPATTTLAEWSGVCMAYQDCQALFMKLNPGYVTPKTFSFVIDSVT